MATSLLAGLCLSLLPFLPLSSAYTWSFVNPPQQCANLSIAINGSDGKPPYRVLIIPFGPTPLPNAIEARRIMDVPFPGTQNHVEFTLKYPENSQFVAVVSDATGFGSGGTSVAAQVTGSHDASCFDAKTNVAPQFYFSIDPPNQIVQCQDTRIYWNPSDVQGIPYIQGVIPGGQSFAIPITSSNLTDVANLGTGCTWKPSLRSGTTLILVAGDNRGNGTGGSILNVVSAGTNQDGSCLSNSSPSSTPGSPAGGSYPTGGGGWTGSSGASSSSTTSNNTGIIVGIVFAVIAFVVASLSLFLFAYRRQKRLKREKERPVDLMYADDDDDGGDTRLGAGQGVGGRSPSRLNELPEFYQPEPYMVPARGSMDGGASYSALHTGMDELDSRRPLSGGTTSMYTRVTTPDLYGGTVAGDSAMSGTSTAPGASGRRKGGAPRPLRPVNVIQHDDAGPPEPHASEDGEQTGEPETIELPPAYSALKGVGRGADSAPEQSGRPQGLRSQSSLHAPSQTNNVSKSGD